VFVSQESITFSVPCLYYHAMHVLCFVGLIANQYLLSSDQGF